MVNYYTLLVYTEPDNWGIKVAISGDTIVTLSAGVAQIWNKDGKLFHTIDENEKISAIAISGDRVVTGSWDGTANNMEHKCSTVIHASKTI